MPSPTPGVHWLVCHTKPRCEKKFSALLHAVKFEHYLPLVESVRRYGRETKRFSKPLFSGYVFAHVPAEERSLIYQQDLLVRAIVASGVEFSVIPLLTVGREVRVIGGPLSGLVGVVDDPTRPSGIVIAVDVLQKGLLVRVPAIYLQPLP
jgi:transcription antitermination factor NusG